MVPTSAGSGFVNLVIAGQKITGPIKPGMTLDLPGLGSVTLKYVNAVTYGSDAAGVEAEVLRVEISQSNALGLPAGATLTVGEAFAGYARAQPKATSGGFAESLGVTANAGTLLNEASSAGSSTTVPACIGTGGTTLTSAVANIAAPGLLSLNAGTTSAFSDPVGKVMVANTTSAVERVSLLGGLVTADAIVAAAQESRVGSISTSSSSGSTFGDLSVAGVPVASNVAANTTISLPGLGYLVLNERPAAVAGHVQVNGLHIVVTLENSLGLPIGAEILLAHADATASAF